MELLVLCASFLWNVWQILQNEAKQRETVYDEKGRNTKVRGNRKFCKRSDDVFPGEWIHFCYSESLDRCTGFRCESARGDTLTHLQLPKRYSKTHTHTHARTLSPPLSLSISVSLSLLRGFQWICLSEKCLESSTNFSQETISWK